MSVHCINTVLDSLFNAWRNNNPEAVTRCFHPNGVYKASIGEGPGETAVGHHAIHALVSKLMTKDMGSTIQMEQVLITHKLAVFRWTYTFQNGAREYGCDIFEFARGRIILKDAYRKVKAG